MAAPSFTHHMKQFGFFNATPQQKSLGHQHINKERVFAFEFEFSRQSETGVISAYSTHD